MVTMTSTYLGAYEVLRRTKAFPTSFWVVYEEKDRLLIEIANDGTQWVKREAIDEALEEGDVERVLEQ